MKNPTTPFSFYDFLGGATVMLAALLVLVVLRAGFAGVAFLLFGGR